jgi:hypothetical protein
MNAKQRRDYWLKVERMRLKLERKYTPLVRAALQDQISSFRDEYAKDPQAALSSINVQLWNEQLLKLFMEMHQETYLLFSSATYNALKREGLKFKPIGLLARWTQMVKDWLRSFAFELVSTITGNTRNMLLGIVNETVQEAMSEGWSNQEATDTVVARLADEQYTYTESRARRIVRTETTRAANKGHMQGARDLPFEVNKIWVSAKDERTRGLSNPNGNHKHDQYDHWELDGQEVELEKPFSSTSAMGVEVDVEQPGDETAPAGFTINCRCRVAFEPKRDQDDRLIMKT